MLHMFGWARLLQNADLVRGVASQVLNAFRATGVLEIGAFISLWMDGDEQYLRDPVMRGIFGQTGLLAFWDRHGSPQFASHTSAFA
jgi:hypothetical protein